jgi:indolepyruvate ferredoxin oxidoreductase beta subunit
MTEQKRKATNVILAGVGGQGSILASHLLADAALKDGHDVKLAETYGGATRGGSVLSHVRIGQAWSHRTPENGADVIVAMEPLEGLRVAIKFLKPGGWMLVNTHPWYPVDVTAGGMPYPSMESILDALKRLGAQVFVMDATELALRAGSERSANMVMLGGVLAFGELDTTEKSLFEAMEERWPTRLVQINRKAYALGHEYVLEHKGQGLERSERKA